tara:strand:+ start:43 stop:897 length:855 start_codon:yes stop_codon:yes gene_type:complete
MGKFFNITIKPTIKASDQHNGAFSAHDLLWDWTKFNIPKGGGCLRGVTALIRGADGAAQTARDLVVYFAEASEDGTAPTSLGAEHATVNGVGYYNNLVGGINMDANDNIGSLDYMNVMSTGGGGGGDQIPFINLTGKPNLTKDGFNSLYIGGIVGAAGDWSFSTNVLTTGALDVSEIATQASIDSLDDGSGGSALATKKFAVGDIIHAQDDIIIGEVTAVNATDLTFRHDGNKQYHANGEVLYEAPANLTAWKIQNGADAAGDLANNDELYNINPITMILHFEH